MTEFVCKLIKSLCGLKQALRQWFSKLSKTFIAVGYIQSKTDHSLFRKISGDSITLILIYVDDLLNSGNSPPEIQNFKLMLSKTFNMNDLGPVSYFQGLEITRSPSSFFISQRKYTLDLLAEYGMTEATLLKIPMDAHMKLNPSNGTILIDPHL